MLEIKNLKKYYGDLRVYEDFSLCIADGETLAVLGASGAGKTTLLNIVAGILPYDGGELIGVPEKVSYIFQTDRLIKHMTVLENLTLVSGEERAKEYLAWAGLADFAGEYPSRLSAGMSRRVAILRAFLYDAPLVLMDEPFRNLDLTLKYELMEFYKSLSVNKTALFVTHDVTEAAYLADRVIVLEKGQIVSDIAVKDRAATEETLKNYFFSKMKKPQ